MDKIAQYRQILIESLENYATAGQPAVGDHPQSLQIHLLLDREHDYYQVLGLGWQGERQICLIIFHFSIQEGKIWLHRNASDYDILADIESKGVPKSDIVLAFHPPQVRKFTDYAVA